MQTYYEEKSEARAAGCRGVAIALLFMLGFVMIALVTQYADEIDSYLNGIVK